MAFILNSKSLLAISAAALVGCSEPAQNNKISFLNLCLGDTRVKGSYAVVPGKVRRNGYPVVKPLQGGSAGSAVLLEECIESRMIKDGMSPAKVAKPRAVAGKLPLPVEYNLLPGDKELWPTLTLTQQKRAIEFLKTGSTIRSSLQGDQ